jgi:hypothetical protein
MHLYPAAKFKKTQDLPDGLMAYIVDVLAILDLGINDPEAMLKKRRKITAGQITIFINRGSQNLAPMGAIPSGIVSPASEKRNPKRRPTDDHVFLFV